MVKTVNRKKAYILLVIVLVMLLCLLPLLIGASVTGVHYFQKVRQTPLVWVHTPQNHQQVQAGDGILLHATARAKDGITRLEAWVDGRFLSAQDAPDGQTPTFMSISDSWESTSLGEHSVVFRAYSNSGTEGQSSIELEVVPVGAGAVGVAHIVQPGETWESIAIGCGATVEEVVAMNPGVELAVGGVITLPVEPPVDEPEEAEMFPPGHDDSESPSAEPSSDPPTAVGDPPGGLLGVFEFWQLPFLHAYLFPGDDIPLRLEVTRLHTASAYDTLHCYVGLGEDLPRWYPDVDGDQSTDESFTHLGGNLWDVQTQLAGTGAPVITWKENLSLDVSMTCVGTRGGGIDAVDLGVVNLSVPPGDWGNVQYTAASAGGEDFFNIQYRVSKAGAVGAEAAMTAPVNLRQGFYSLLWDYTPAPGEAPADMFRVYANGALLWTTPGSFHGTLIPSEWLDPPCGVEYAFTVTAYRFAEDSESVYSNTLTTRSSNPSCTRKLAVTFTNLKTSSYIAVYDISSRVGPVYGYMTANDRLLYFDGRCSGGGCTPFSLLPEQEVDMAALMATYGSPHTAQIFLDLAPGEDLTLAYDIWDADSGADDHLCHAELVLDSASLGEYQDDFLSDWISMSCSMGYSILPITE